MDREIDFEKIKSQLLRHEGLKLKAYRDIRGVLTIGVGRNLEGKGISHDEAMLFFANDVNECVDLVLKVLPWSKDLDDDRFLVLVNMCFQMGISGLLGFRKFLDYLRRGKFDKAGAEMLDSKWAREDSPKRAIELYTVITGTP